MASRMRLVVQGIAAMALALGLNACGGGGGNSGASASTGGGSGGVLFMPATNYINKCAAPRSGASTVTRQIFPDIQGSALDEKNWLRSWTHELYLWYREVPDLNPANTPGVIDYFKLLKTSATSPSGQPKDKFHFTYATAEWEALALTGMAAGYGLGWEIIQGTQTSAPRLFVAYLEPGGTTPAAQAALTRGVEVLGVDGITLSGIFSQAQADIVNAGISPGAVGQSHSFDIRERNGTTRTVTMVSAQISTAPVQQVKTLTDGMGKVGYMLFNDHLATAEGALVDAVTALRQQNITDLIVDMRYNGGGYLIVASELAYMIAGAGSTAGRIFEHEIFNDQHPTTNPVTGRPLQPTLFATATVGLSRPSGQPLPVLDLARVFLLVGGGTCSASESVINGLRGIDVEVVLIGSTTCGKPYGFYPADNCGTTYFSIQIEGENDKNFGDYSDGFSPNNTVGLAGVRVPGCSVADDFAHELGDPLESRFAAALSYRFTQSCPAATGFSPQDRVQPQSAQESKPSVQLSPTPPWRQNRILGP